MRLIDANALLEHIKDLPTWWDDGGGVYGQAMKYPEGMFDVDDVVASIENAPTLTQPNEPLTLEVLAKSQLLQMLGEKVEVIRMGEMCQAEWSTVRSFGDCKTDSGCSCCHELYGKTWIAYRRPPEEVLKDGSTTD